MESLADVNIDSNWLATLGVGILSRNICESLLVCKTIEMNEILERKIEKKSSSLLLWTHVCKCIQVGSFEERLWSLLFQSSDKQPREVGVRV